MNIKIFAADVTQHAIEQMGAPSKESRNSSVFIVPLIPASTAARSDECLVYLTGVPDEGIDDILLGLYVFDIFSRQLLYPLGEIISGPVEGLD